MKTTHSRLDRPPITFEGDHLFEVVARVEDSQAHLVVAADDEWKARSRFMVAETTLKPRGQEVVFAVRKVDQAGKPCIWGRCNGTQGPDGRCNRCGSKRP